MKTTRAVVGTFLVLGALIFIGTTTASGQDGDAPYQPNFGDLTVEGTDFTVGSQVILSGDGFRPEAPVQLTVRPNDSDSVAADTDAAADTAGAVRVELMLSEDFSPGSYTATVMGPAVDGATVQLSGVIVVYATPAEVPPTPVPATPVPRPTPTVQAPIQAQPTATPLPDPGVRNDPPPTPAPTTPVTEDDDSDGAVGGDSGTAGTGDGDSSTEGSNDGAVATSDDDDETPATSSDDAGSDNDSDGGSDDTSGDNDGADQEELAAAGIGDGSSSGGWGTIHWVGLFAALVLIGGAIPVLRYFRTPVAGDHTPLHSDD